MLRRFVLCAGLLCAMLTAAPAGAQQAADPHEEAVRLMAQADFYVYQMITSSAAGLLYLSPGILIATHQDVDYIEKSGRVTEFGSAVFYLAAAMEALQRSPLETDRFAYRVLLARLAWLAGDADDAAARIFALLGEAEAKGWSDRQLVSLLADAWKVEEGRGNERAAAAYLARAASCGEYACPDDILFGLHAETKAAEDAMPAGRRSAEDRVADAEAFLKREFPARLNAMAEVYSDASYALEDTRPIDAAKMAELAFAVAERDKDLAIDSFVSRALSAMKQNLRAGRYQTVSEIASRAADRDMSRMENPYTWIRFQQVWMRALVQLDHPQAEASMQWLADFIAGNDWLANKTDAYVLAVFPLLQDYSDTPFLAATETLLGALEKHFNGYDMRSVKARLRARQGKPAEAAEIIRGIRTGTYETPLREDTMNAFTIQEAAYREAAGETAEAAALRAGVPQVPRVIPEVGAKMEAGLFAFNAGYDYIRPAAEFRDWGNFEGAAWWMAKSLRYAPTMAANGEYGDSQALWQMAFTFARAGEQTVAFDLMSRAAKIASNLSFENADGPSGGSLQLLERDRVRYLLFIDIAWGAISGDRPQDMLVLSRY